MTSASASAKKSQPDGPPASQSGAFGVLQCAAVKPSPVIDTRLSGTAPGGDAMTRGSPWAGREVVRVVAGVPDAPVVVVVARGTDVLVVAGVLVDVLVLVVVLPASKGNDLVLESAVQAPVTTSPAIARPRARRRRLPVPPVCSGVVRFILRLLCRGDTDCRSTRSAVPAVP